MNKDILIVEDEFVVANDLQLTLQKAGYEVTGIADSVEEAISMIEKRKPSMVLLDIYLKGNGTGIDLAKYLAEQDIAYVYLSANSNEKVMEAAKATQPYGFLVKPFREKDVLVTLEVAHYRHAHSMESKLRKEQSLQLALTGIMAEDSTWEQKLLNIATTFQQAVPFDYAILGLAGQDNSQPDMSVFFRIGYEEYQATRYADFLSAMQIMPAQFSRMLQRFTDKGPSIFNGGDFESLSAEDAVTGMIAKKIRVNSNIVIQLPVAGDKIFFFSFYNRHPETYAPEHLQLLMGLKSSLVLTIERLLAFDEVKKLSEQLKREKTYLQEEVKTASNFDEIIGSSHSLLHVLDQVTQVARLDTSVLLLGESGTGKELVARAIHNLSPRKDKLLVKVNCAALPASLIESELFGHEKGSFTGATDKRIGKFELAQGSTIFLDEIGEMPMDLQVKLLRVLQEKEIERIGGKQTIKIDVRIIAATNRDLEKEIANGKFRLDLYYRLNVFPITLPPLRSRKEDISILANHFANKFSRKTGKPFNGIKSSAMEELLRYHWPGNIREMENLIEQAFVLNDGKSQLQWGRPLVNTTAGIFNAVKEASPTTLDEVKELQQATEREYILSVLKRTNGRIRGAGGAAEILNLKPTTLESRIEKLGIKKIHITS